jgi:hypothetical protein
MEHSLGHRSSRGPSHRPHAHHLEYNRFRGDPGNYGESHQTRQSTDNLRYVEDEYPVQPPVFRPERRRPSKPIAFNKAIRQLAGVLDKAEEFFLQFEDDFERDVERSESR